MRAVFGLLLMMFGLALTVVWLPAHDAERQLAVVTDIFMRVLPRSSEGGGPVERTFASSTPLLAVVEQNDQRRAVHSVAVAHVTIPASGAVARGAMSATQVSTTPSVVTGMISEPVVPEMSGAQTAARLAELGTPRRHGAVLELSRYELVRSIQRELKRVGCYTGEVDGDWGPASRRAMNGFTDRVNATLPTTQPDFILLTLLQGQQGSVCGRLCPAGQSPSDTGRCLPNAVLAHSRAPQERRSPLAVSTGPSDPSGWSPSYMTGPAVTTTTGVTPAAIAALVAGTTASSGRLPGRMSVGGPATSGLDTLAAPFPARAATGTALPEASNQSVRGGSTARRERPRRRSARNPSPRYDSIQGPPVVVYRAPRVASQRSYARRSSGAWTATFFRTN